MKIFDYVIIGAGCTGSYLARRLQYLFPSAKILIIEKTIKYGGRHQSHYLKSKFNPKNIAYEYGGMRYYPSIHPRVSKILKLLNIKSSQINDQPPNNINYVRSHAFTNNFVFPESDKIYYIHENELNKNVFTLVNNSIKKTIGKYSKNIADYENRKKFFNIPKYSELPFSSIIGNDVTRSGIGISHENYNRYIDLTGYSNVFSDMSFSVGSVENLALENRDMSMFFVQKGFNQIEKKLLKRFNIVGDIKQTKKLKHCIIYNSIFTKFKKKHNYINCYFKQILSNQDPEFETCSYLSKHKIKTKNLFICTQKKFNTQIKGFNKKYSELLNDITISFNVVKIYLKYNNNWWNKLGFTNEGKNITDLFISQAWFYDENTILIYSLYDSATFWKGILPYKIQREFVDVNSDNLYNLSNILTDQLKKIFTCNDIPFPNKISWNYWNEALSFWKSYKNELSNTVNIEHLRNKIHYPFGIKGGIYSINSDFSLNQGWSEGCLEEVDQIIYDLYHAPSLLQIKEL